MHRAALAAHAQAEGRVEQQERREQGVKDEVPGIQVQSPQIHLFADIFIVRHIEPPWLLMHKQRAGWPRRRRFPSPPSRSKSR